MKMRNIRLRSIAALSVVATLGVVQSAHAQASATANGSATLVPAISLVNTTGLQFGLIVGGPGGTVAVGTDGTRTASGPSLMTNAGYPVTAAAFTVSGLANQGYSITLPSTATLTGPGAATMTIGSFVSNPSATGTIGGGGTQTLLVGATLTIGASQAVGDYTGSFSVTVNYQ